MQDEQFVFLTWTSPRMGAHFLFLGTLRQAKHLIGLPARAFLSNCGDNSKFLCLFLKMSPVQSLSPVWVFATPWTTACQAPLSMGFSRHEYWNGLPFPTSGDFSNPGKIKPTSLVSPVLAGGFFNTSASWEAQVNSVLVAQSHLILCDPLDYSPPGSSVHGNSPGKNTGVGCHALLQGIFLTQGLIPGLPHCRQILDCLSHEGSPWILEWVACPFCRGSSWPRNWARVSCIACRFFTRWAPREALNEL